MPQNPDPSPSKDAATSTPPGCVLALDIGDRRIGLALSDPLRTTVRPFGTLHRSSRRNDLRYFERLFRRQPCTEMVAGLPLHLSGDRSPQAAKVEAFVELLRSEFGLPVHLWDERMSTAEAHRLLDEAERNPATRKEIIDQLSAVLILESWLAAQRSRRP